MRAQDSGNNVLCFFVQRLQVAQSREEDTPTRKATSTVAPISVLTFLGAPQKIHYLGSADQL